MLLFVWMEKKRGSRGLFIDRKRGMYEWNKEVTAHDW